MRDEVLEVAAQDVAGVPFRQTLRGEAARAFQHELDHLDGVLILDHAGLAELPPAVQELERLHEGEPEAGARPAEVEADAGRADALAENASLRK